MKQNLSTTTIVVVLIVVLLAVALIGWRIMAGKENTVDPTAVDNDAETMKMMQDSMKKNQPGGMAPAGSPSGN